MSSEYERLRAELAELGDLFEEAAEGYLPLHQQKLYADWEMHPDDRQPFILANSRPDEDWQQLEIAGGGRYCFRFFGSEEGFNECVRLVGVGYDLLAAIRRVVDAGDGVPESVVLA